MSEYLSIAATDVTFVPVIKAATDIVQKIAGVQFDERQHAMVISRLKRRMSELNIEAPEQYLTYIKANHESESNKLVSLLTTHHTFFFRESEQFDFLLRDGLPKIIAAVRKQGRNHLRVWSMAMSRGHEVYTLSMFLAYHMPRLAPGMTYEILGTDVDTACVKTARNGVYRWDEVKTIPSLYLGGNWSRGTGDIAEFAKAKENIKKPCRFDVGNLLAIPKPQEVGLWDLIFCRNVFIYFKPEQITQIAAQVRNLTENHGYFVIGLSENLGDDRKGFHLLGGSVYAHSAPKKTEDAAAKATPVRTPTTPAPLRVLVVDDSATIIAMLKSILTKDQGFEIVGQAADGQAAANLASQVKFDVMTLDLQMPVLDGFGYLDQYVKNKPNHPPVVVVSSRNRDDMEVGPRVMNAGAKDFVEKPTVSDLAERATEIRSKLRAAARFFTASDASSRISDAASLSKTFAQSTVQWTNDALRIVLVSATSINWIRDRINSEPSQSVPTVLIPTSSTIDALLRKEIKRAEYSFRIPTQGHVAIGSLAELSAHRESVKNRKVSLVVTLGSFDIANELLQMWPNGVFLLEEDAPTAGWQPARWPKLVPRTSILTDAERVLRVSNLDKVA